MAVNDLVLAELLESHAKALRGWADVLDEIMRGLHDMARGDERLVSTLRISPSEPIPIKPSPKLTLVDNPHPKAHFTGRWDSGKDND